MEIQKNNIPNPADNFFQSVKDKKVLITLALLAIVFVVIVVLIAIVLVMVNKRPVSPTVVIPPSKEKITKEILESYSASRKSGKDPIPVAGEVIKSFSVSNAGSKNNKNVQPSPTVNPITEEIIKSFSGASAGN